MFPVVGGRSRAGRRQVVRSLARSAVASVLLVAAYYLVPLDATEGPLVWLVVGLAAVAVVIAWQLRAIVNAEYPRLRAIGALATGLPLLLVVFAMTYVIQARGDPGAFNEPLDRTAALYFTVTVFATVGFGDIVPVTTAARVATMLQMLLDLVAVGVLAKVILGAVDVGLRRRSDQGAATDDDGRAG